MKLNDERLVLLLLYNLLQSQLKLKKWLQLLLLLTMWKFFVWITWSLYSSSLRIIHDTQIIFISGFILSSVQIFVSG